MWWKLLLKNPKFIGSLVALIVAVAASLGYSLDESGLQETISYVVSLVLMAFGAKDTQKKVKEEKEKSE